MAAADWCWDGDEVMAPKEKPPKFPEPGKRLYPTWKEEQERRAFEKKYGRQGERKSV
jgi:hypothetical protein